MNLNECKQEDVCKVRFEGLKEEVAELKNKVIDLDKINVTLAELKLLSEQNITANTERDKIVKVNTEALIQVSHTLEALCREFQESKDRNEIRENKVDDKFAESQKIIDELKTEMQKKFEAQDQKISAVSDQDKIGITEIVRYAIVAAITCGSTYYVTTLLSGIGK